MMEDGIAISSDEEGSKQNCSFHYSTLLSVNEAGLCVNSLSSSSTYSSHEESSEEEQQQPVITTTEAARIPSTTPTQHVAVNII